MGRIWIRTKYIHISLSIYFNNVSRHFIFYKMGMKANPVKNSYDFSGKFFMTFFPMGSHSFICCQIIQIVCSMGFHISRDWNFFMANCWFMYMFLLLEVPFDKYYLLNHKEKFSQKYSEIRPVWFVSYVYLLSLQ